MLIDYFRRLGGNDSSAYAWPILFVSFMKMGLDLVTHTKIV